MSIQKPLVDDRRSSRGFVESLSIDACAELQHMLLTKQSILRRKTHEEMIL